MNYVVSLTEAGLSIWSDVTGTSRSGLPAVRLLGQVHFNTKSLIHLHKMLTPMSWPLKALINRLRFVKLSSVLAKAEIIVHSFLSKDKMSLSCTFVVRDRI